MAGRPRGSGSRLKMPGDDRLSPTEMLVFKLLRDTKHGTMAEGFVLEALRVFGVQIAEASDPAMARLMGPMIWRQWRALAQEATARVDALYAAQTAPVPTPLEQKEDKT